MKKRLSLLLLSFIAACPFVNAQFAVHADSIRSRIKILASDEFQGRRPFTAGEKKTIPYLVQSFKEMGLEPGNGKSYIQPVPMVAITPAAPPQLNITKGKEKIALKNFDDYVVWTENGTPTTAIPATDIVFAGFGVTAPENNWDDYAGINVKGKMVLIMINDPGFTTGDSTLFQGKRMTYYGRWTYKYEEAARHGAAGCIIIHNTDAASYPFQVVQNSNAGTRLYLDKRGSKEYHCPLTGWVTADAAKKILSAAGLNADSLYIAANHRGFKSFTLPEKASAKFVSKAEYNVSNNVVAKITGTTYPDEYIVYTAHWDHFGVGKPDAKGDTIYNGALDNASGTAVLLELARAFKNSPVKPKRTIIFLSVTGEEQGLLGSEYYTTHPIYPLYKTIANMNFDGINIFGRTKDAVVVGKGQSELEDYYEQFAAQQQRYVTAEPKPEAGSYYRSDHFNFAKVGVPALDAATGVDVVGKGREYGMQQRDNYNKYFYHTPSDEYSDSWNLDGALENIQIMYLLGTKLANERIYPQWKKTSEFKAIRERSLKRKI
ncbi:MAG: M28 family peptidase [Bacteroidetes bacterium]|nr:M28 family peptidase [Bacteroidota bacterium]